MVVLIPGEGELAFGGSQDDDDTEDASPGSKELAAMVEAATAASVELDAAADWAQQYGDDRMPCAPARVRAGVTPCAREEGARGVCGRRLAPSPALPPSSSTPAASRRATWTTPVHMRCLLKCVCV
nr:protein FAR1-RELATED SEQUENCE 6-like [Triticum aestivum]